MDPGIQENPKHNYNNRWNLETLSTKEENSVIDKLHAPPNAITIIHIRNYRKFPHAMAVGCSVHP